MYIFDEVLDRWLREDIPYLDLTTHVLGFGQKAGTIRFQVREDSVICGTEEGQRIFDKLGIQTLTCLPSGTAVTPGTVVLEGQGKAENLHRAWKVVLNILEYASGIATRTWRLKQVARAENPRISILTTRKVFPGTKELAIKGVLAGGGAPHRLGLSETVLIFRQHLDFLGGVDVLAARLEQFRGESIEKKILVEADNLEDACKLAIAGVDGIQFDKQTPEFLQDAVQRLRAINPRIVLLAAGGINEQNGAAYARTGVDGLVTSAVYFGKPVDIGASMEGE